MKTLCLPLRSSKLENMFNPRIKCIVDFLSLCRDYINLTTMQIKLVLKKLSSEASFYKMNSPPGFEVWLLGGNLTPRGKVVP
jgi:hypothetical protein